MAKLTSREARARRHRRIRRRVAGTSERPRLAVFRSIEHIYAQIIDDTTGQTLVAASTLEPEIREQINGRPKKDEAKIVGKVLGERAKAKGIDNVVFDRGGFLYHGRVQALADGAREAGLVF